VKQFELRCQPGPLLGRCGLPHPAKGAVAGRVLRAVAAAEYAVRQVLHDICQLVDPVEVFGSSPCAGADLQDRVGDKLRRDYSLGSAPSPARSPGPHGPRLAQSRMPENTVSVVPILSCRAEFMDWRPGRGYFLTLLEPSRDDRTLALTARSASRLPR
jgi:hypothetical protein